MCPASGLFKVDGDAAELMPPSDKCGRCAAHMFKCCKRSNWTLMQMHKSIGPMPAQGPCCSPGDAGGNGPARPILCNLLLRAWTSWNCRTSKTLQSLQLTDFINAVRVRIPPGTPNHHRKSRRLRPFSFSLRNFDIPEVPKCRSFRHSCLPDLRGKRYS